MNSIIKHTGEYIVTAFDSKDGIWELISSVCEGGGPMACKDTFVNRKKGSYKERVRALVYEQAENRDIYLP